MILQELSQSGTNDGISSGFPLGLGTSIREEAGLVQTKHLVQLELYLMLGLLLHPPGLGLVARNTILGGVPGDFERT